MKKIIALIVIIIAMFVSSTAFAVPVKNDQSDGTRTDTGIKSLAEQKKILEKKIEENRKKLDNLKVQSRKAYNGAKARINKLMKQRNKLTKAQIDKLAEDVKLLKQYTEKLERINSNIGTEVTSPKDAFTESSMEDEIKAMNDKIEKQLSRISEYESIIQGMDSIAKI